MSNKNHKSKAKTISRIGISVRSVKSLVDAIAADGLTIPLLVINEGNRNVIVGGHRRFAAMNRLIRGNRQVDLFQ